MFYWTGDMKQRFYEQRGIFKLLREALRETEHSNQKNGEIHGTAADGATYIVLPLAPLRNPCISPHLSTFPHIF